MTPKRHSVMSAQLCCNWRNAPPGWAKRPGGSFFHREVTTAGCITFFTTYSPI